jgi:hypothetical protein
MRAWAKVVLWAGIFLACAGVGAFIASRSNPFPPGVPDPGRVSPTGTPGPAMARWTVTMLSRTTHTFHVGGACTSNWRMRTRIRVDEDGRIAGRGVARLLPGARCDFPSAQVQAERIDLVIAGRRRGDELDLRFRTAGLEPVGAQDLGAFVRTLPSLRFSVGEQVGAQISKPHRIEDPEHEIYASVTVVRISR